MRNILLLALVASGCATETASQRREQIPYQAPQQVEVKQALEDYTQPTGIRCLAAATCGRSEEVDCLRALEELAATNFDVDLQRCSNEALVARCAKGGREAIAAAIKRGTRTTRYEPPPSSPGAEESQTPVARRARAKKRSRRNNTELVGQKEEPVSEPTERRVEVLLDGWLVTALQQCPSADGVYALLKEEDRDFAPLVDALHLPHRGAGDELARLTAIWSLPEPKTDAAAAVAERRREADSHLVAARDALTAAKYDDAVREADAAERAGASVADLRKEISGAKEAAGQQHQSRAREFVKKNDPDGALEEVEKAEALMGGPASLTDLREAIAKTPKARGREALRKAEVRREEGRRVAARRETCRVMRASVSDVSHRRALQVANVFTTGALDPYQQTVNLVNAIDVMGNSSSVYAQNALARVDAGVMVSAVRGGVPRSHAGLGISRGNLVQQRDKVFASLLNRVIAERGQLSGRVHDQVQGAGSFEDYLLASKGNFTSYTTIVAAAIPDLPEKVFRAAVAEMYCAASSSYAGR